MIVVPDLTEELLRSLGEELGGCDFSDENQRAFLRRTDACDVQAAPGNGKTTLLIAKLALLSRAWTDRGRGICVVSHTNVAREEVQRRLGEHPSASAFLAYPHFIGTVTSFIDQFIALPYLRGLRWPIRRIDDEAFAAAAKGMISGKRALRASYRQRAHQVETWVASLTLADSFVAPEGEVGNRLAVRAARLQPGPNSDSGRELEEIKAALVARGLYRYEDMHVLARRALLDTPHLAQRLRNRFPLAILDEAQDTSGALLQILNQVFADAAFQRLGDQNQTLYEDAAIPRDQYWAPRADSISLDRTRRFGPPIAQFASRLTARRAQQIVADERPAHRLLMTFDRPAIAGVLPRYAARAAERLGHRAGSADIRAVASRHSLYRDARGEWPKSLTDYYPAYRNSEDKSSHISTLCGAMRRLASGHASGRHPRESHALIGAALADYLDHRGYRSPDGKRLSGNTIWTSLAALGAEQPIRARQLVIEHIIRGRAAQEARGWTAFCNELLDIFPLPGLGLHGAYCAFVEEGAASLDEPDLSPHYAQYAGVKIRLGSVHSVKGLTADSVLMVETEVYRGPARDMRAMDLATVLPHAFGLEEQAFHLNDAALAAATNVFVAVTRPRDLLALAVRHDAVNDALLMAAHEQGWQVVRVDTA